MGTTEYSFPVALKTGSSQGLRDAWTIAYTRRYLLGVWIGHPDARPMRDVTGAGNAAELVRRILKPLHSDEGNGSADLSFPRPQGYVAVPICARSGKRATPSCDPVFEEWFKPGQEPQQEDDVHVRLAVDIRNGMLANARTPAQYVEHRNFVNLPPRYAEWAAQAGLPRPPDAVSIDGQVGSAPAARVLPAALRQNLNAGASHQLRILSPRDGLNLLHDPTLPPLRNTIALQVEVDPPVPEVLWTVDGKPYKLVPYPYVMRWPLQVGEHVMRATVPLTHEASPPVHVQVE
jgi:penicillin-binding protein 1C